MPIRHREEFVVAGYLPSPRGFSTLILGQFNREGNWSRAHIARDVGLPAGPHSATEFTLAHNVSSKAEVDAVMARAERAGAVIAKGATETFWGGYAGYFQDPDGHLWEVAWNPAWTG